MRASRQSSRRASGRSTGFPGRRRALWAAPASAASVMNILVRITSSARPPACPTAIPNRSAGCCGGPWPARRTRCSPALVATHRAGLACNQLGGLHGGVHDDAELRRLARERLLQALGAPPRQTQRVAHGLRPEVGVAARPEHPSDLSREGAEQHPQPVLRRPEMGQVERQHHQSEHGLAGDREIPRGDVPRHGGQLSTSDRRPAVLFSR